MMTHGDRFPRWHGIEPGDNDFLQECSASAGDRSSALAARVPAAAMALAGIDLDWLRGLVTLCETSHLRAGVSAPFGRAHLGLDCLSTGSGDRHDCARRRFGGATQVAADVALSGAPGAMAAAMARHAPAGILRDAETVAASRPLWVVIRGGITLPLEGNFANLNNLLRVTEYVTMAGRALVIPSNSMWAAGVQRRRRRSGLNRAFAPRFR